MVLELSLYRIPHRSPLGKEPELSLVAVVVCDSHNNLMIGLDITSKLYLRS